MAETSRTEFGSRAELLANQDDCLLAIEDGRPVPAAKLANLPPWRAVMIARIAARAGVPLERGTLGQLHAEARQVGGEGTLGPWWNQPDDGPSDEDRIRDAMAEARDHPGRTITR